MEIMKKADLIDIDRMMNFANLFVKSSLCPAAYKNKPEDAIVAIQLGYELGIQPLQAINNIAVINGRPTVWGDLAKAIALAHPDCEGVEEYFTGEYENGTLVAHCKAFRKGKEILSSFSIAQAKRAGLWGKQGPWTQYSERMLQMRARGFCLRDAFPDALKGVYLREEMEGSDLNFKQTKNVPDFDRNKNKKPDVIEGEIENKAEEDETTPEEIENQFSFCLTLIKEATNKEDLKDIGNKIKDCNFDSDQKVQLAQEYQKKLDEMRVK